MRALSDQMEPIPPQVRELKQALAVAERERAGWELRAGVQEERADKAQAAAARLRELLEEVQRVGALPITLSNIIRHALAQTGGGE